MNATALPAMPTRRPFDPEDTDWGRKVDRQHQENLQVLREGRERFEKVEEEVRATKETVRSLAAAVEQRFDDMETADNEAHSMISGKLDKLIEELDPYLKLRRIASTGVQSATKIGRFGNRVADWMLHAGKAGAIGLALWFAFSAMAHGANPWEALKLLWQIVWR